MTNKSETVSVRVYQNDKKYHRNRKNKELCCENNPIRVHPYKQSELEKLMLRDYFPGDRNIYSGKRVSLLKLELLSAHLAFVHLIVYP